jgi:hypothetical protein
MSSPILRTQRNQFLRSGVNRIEEAAGLQRRLSRELRASVKPGV